MALEKNGRQAAFATVTTLFFAWGFITATVDPLIAALKSIFHLSYAEVMLTQFAFFMAYGLFSLPSAALVARLGYLRSILAALGVMIVGCLWVPIATHADAYGLVLVALFIIASGITVLQVAANPLAAGMGTPDLSHFRLTLSQGFNSLGTTVAPYLASMVILTGGIFAARSTATTIARRNESLRHIDLAFLGLAVLTVSLAVLIWLMRARFEREAPSAGASAGTSGTGEARSMMSIADALRSRWAVLGAMAIFLYVGSEVSIGSAMTNLLHQPDVFHISFEQAGKWLSLYWGGAMIGRFAGSALLTRLRASTLLAAAAAVAALLCLLVSHAPGPTAGWAALSVGLFNSIMFPVIFTLTIDLSTASVTATSGLLCMAIVGGAVLPVIVGQVADSAGLRAAYAVPMVAYVCISAFGLSASRRCALLAAGAGARHA